MQVQLAAFILLATVLAMAQGEGEGTIDFELALGSPLENRNRGGSSDMVVVMLDEETAILCFVDRPSAEAPCWTLLPKEFGWRQTQWYPADDREVDRFAMARLSDTRALTCYRLLEGPNAQTAECRRVNSTGGGEGGALVLDAEGIVNQSAACLTETDCVLCYATSAGKVSCAPVFAEEGAPLAQGEAIEVGAGSSVAVVGFSRSTAVVCRQAEGASCNMLTVGADRSLSLGESASLDSRTTEVDIAKLSDNSGVACYVIDSVPQYGVCVPFWLEGGEIKMGSAQAELMDNVNVGLTADITVAGVSDTAAVVCYLEGVNRAGMCSGLVLNRMGSAEDASFEVGAHQTIVFELKELPAACSEEGACSNFLTASAALSPVNEEATLCYARHDGIHCRTVGVPAPTTTTTATSATTITTTSPHTTTETSTTTIPETAGSRLAAPVSVVTSILAFCVAAI